jgi:hypothetical protein
LCLKGFFKHELNYTNEVDTGIFVFVC